MATVLQNITASSLDERAFYIASKLLGSAAEQSDETKVKESLRNYLRTLSGPHAATAIESAITERTIDAVVGAGVDAADEFYGIAFVHFPGVVIEESYYRLRHERQIVVSCLDADFEPESLVMETLPDPVPNRCGGNVAVRCVVVASEAIAGRRVLTLGYVVEGE